jgi:hypothetical protein
MKLIRMIIINQNDDSETIVEKNNIYDDRYSKMFKTVFAELQ